MDGEDELFCEDFSVYVAPPASAPEVGDDELIARLEPGIAMVALPLIVLALVASLVYVRLRALHSVRPDEVRTFAAAAVVVLASIAALPYFYYASYFAELYGDRLVVRRGKSEWAIPLEQIASIEPYATPAHITWGEWRLTLLDQLARGGSLPELSRSASPGYLVITSFGSGFPLPPFPGDELFAMRVYQQRAARLRTASHP